MNFKTLFSNINNEKIQSVEIADWGFQLILQNNEKIRASYPQGWNTRVEKNFQQLEKIVGKNLFDIQIIFEYQNTDILYVERAYLLVGGIKQSNPLFKIEWPEEAMEDWYNQYNEIFRGEGLNFDWERTPEYYEKEKQTNTKKPWYKKIINWGQGQKVEQKIVSGILWDSDSLRIGTEENYVLCKKGDYLLRDHNNPAEWWVMDAATFQRLYEFIGEVNGLGNLLARRKP